VLEDSSFAQPHNNGMVAAGDAERHTSGRKVVAYFLLVLPKDGRHSGSVHVSLILPAK
jgi:hypothetical protein